MLKAADTFEQPTAAINQLWQTDVTHLKVTGWGWCDLSTVMDDYSRYILAWRLCQTMSAREVTDTLKAVLIKVAGPAKKHRPKLLSDAGSVVSPRNCRIGWARTVSATLKANPVIR